jgi:hypothetical protein
VFSLPAVGQSLVVECVDHAQATMYLDNSLTASHAHELRRLAQLLPPRVRVLRVQLRASDTTESTMNALRDVVHVWRRRGTVHLVFVGGLSPVRAPIPVEPTAVDAALEWSSAAHTAAFL